MAVPQHVARAFPVATRDGVQHEGARQPVRRIRLAEAQLPELPAARVAEGVDLQLEAVGGQTFEEAQLRPVFALAMIGQHVEARVGVERGEGEDVGRAGLRGR